MRKTIADLVALGALAAALAGGCTPGLDIPSYGPPRIAGIYGVNIAPQVQTPGVAGNGLPDFQLYALADPGNGDPHLASPPTGPLPPVYQTLRIDFDQPMDGSTLAALPTLASAVVGPQSFCNPLPNPSIQLLDAAGVVVLSSVCYESGSALGQHAHVYVTPGAGTLTTPPATLSPFTCNSFSPADGGEYFKSGSTYSIRFASAEIKSSSGQPLQLPTGAGAADAAAGWSFANNTFRFGTTGFDVMAVGYQNQATGYFYFNAKPNAAFIPFRDPIPDAAGLPCKVGDDPAKPCRLGADNTPYFVFLTRPVSTRPVYPGSLTKANVALTRSSGAPAEYSLSLGATLLQDASTGSTAPTPPDVIVITPGHTWEPGEKYTLTLRSGGLTSDDNLALTGPNATSYAFTVVDTKLAAPAAFPLDGTPNIPFTGTSATLTYLAPVAVDLMGNPIGTFTLKQGGTTVPCAAPGPTARCTAVVGPSQIVTLTATSDLLPETVYTVSASGVKVAAGARNAGAPQPDLAGSQFVTASLQLSEVADGKKPGAGNAINRSTAVDPALLYTGNMTAFFNDQMTNVTPATVVLSEAGGPALANETVAMGADASQWTIRVPAASEPFKFNQRYQIHFDQTIAGASATGSGHSLKIFPCVSGADCSDNEFFTTLPYAPTIASTTIDAAGNLVDFTVAFKYPATPESVSLANGFYIFAKNPNGTVDLGRKIQPNCTPTPVSAPTAIKCTPPAGTTFARNTTYLYGATFGGPVPGGGGTVPAAAAASPVSVTPATGPAFTVPVDPKSSTFTGSVTGTFTTGC
jgi:hypothetical protein